MTTIASMELSDAADVAEEKGKQEQADDLRLLASYGAGVPEDDTPTQQNSEMGDSLDVMADAIEELPYPWNWRNWFPAQQPILLIGESKIGKSSCLHKLAADFTRGVKMPDGQPLSEPAGVVYISYEEDKQSVLVPALRKAGADLSKIAVLTKVRRPACGLSPESEGKFEVPRDLPLLEYWIRKIEAIVVFIDPLMAMVNVHQSVSRNQSAREIWDQLEAVASRTGVSIVIVGHLNKGKSKDLMQRAGGSKGLTDVARTVIGMARNVNNVAQTVMWVEKQSNGPEPMPLVFERDPRDLSQIIFVSGEVASYQAIAAEERLSRTRQDILDVLESDVQREFDARVIAQRTGIDVNTCRVALQRMTKDEQIFRTARGFYQAISFCPWPQKKNAVPSVPSVPNEKEVNHDGSTNGAGVYSDIHSGDDSRSSHSVLDTTNNQDTKVADDKTVMLNGHQSIENLKTERIA